MSDRRSDARDTIGIDEVVRDLIAKMGRRKPYTARGIRRVPCVKCGRPSMQQWQICSLDNRWMGVCADCDVKLNAAVLKFLGFNATPFLRRYERRLKGP